MSYKEISPIPVIEGGTGAQTLTGVLLGHGTSAVTAITAGDYGILISSATGVPSWLANGTTGEILTATTSGIPSWESPAASSISITGDSGGALTGNAFTFTGSTTGLTFAGAGSTETLGGTLVVSNGGTGAATLTGVLIGHGTSAVTGNAITQYDVLIGGASNAISSVAPSATSGVPLISQGSSSNPAFGTAVVAGGGTGDTSFTAYAVICGGTSSTAALQSIASVGTSGYVLTSNGAGALPTFQAASAGGIVTIDGNSGSVTGSTVTFTGGTSGAVFTGSGTTMTESFNYLSLPITTSTNGQILIDGVTFMHAYGDSNIYNTFVGNRAGNFTLTGASAVLNTGIGFGALQSLTTGSYNSCLGYAAGNLLSSGSRNVCFGNGSGAVTTGSYNIILGFQGGDNYTSGESSNIILNALGTVGESNVTRIGAGTGTGNYQQNKLFICGVNGITVSSADQVLLVNSSDQLGAVAHGTSGQAFISGGSGANPAWGTLSVSGGGTGDTSFTAYSVLCGGTTSTGALQNVSGVGTSGQVLTSNGASALPTWQAAGGGGGITTLDADSGSATGSTVTISGGSTGLTTSGSSATIDITGTLGIANGGTDATSFTQSNGIVTYNGTRLVNYAGPQISSGGIQTNSSQPAFQAYLSASDSNVTGTGQIYQLGSGNALTIVLNQGSNFTTGGVFTAPVTGLYFFNFNILATNVTTTASTTWQPVINTTASTFNLAYQGSSNVAAGGFLGGGGSIVCKMTAGDTCTFELIGTGGTGKTMGVDGGQGLTFCGGYLIC